VSFDLKKMLESKRALRRDLAARPIAEKLRMLDDLRERALAIRAASPAQHGASVREEPPSYRKIENFK